MRIRMDDVTPGMKLETPIVKNDVILVKAGEVLTPHMINRLNNILYWRVKYSIRKSNSR